MWTNQEAYALVESCLTIAAESTRHATTAAEAEAIVADLEASTIIRSHMDELEANNEPTPKLIAAGVSTRLRQRATEYADEARDGDTFRESRAFARLQSAAREFVVHELAQCRRTIPANELAAILRAVLIDGGDDA